MDGSLSPLVPESEFSGPLELEGSEVFQFRGV